LVMAIYTGITVADKFKSTASTTENPPIQMADSAIIQVDVLKDDLIKGYGKEGIPLGNVQFNIEKNTTDSFPTLEIKKQSQGKDRQFAFDLAQRIQYYYELDSNKLVLADHFMLDKGNKFRGQNVQVTLNLPVGYQVYLTEGTGAVISNIRNIQEVWDGDMPGHTWTMTRDGLSCNDCEDEIIRKGKEYDEDGNITIKVKTEDGDETITVN